jgi:hypothetical protein
MIFPEPEILNLFAADLWVFSFGIFFGTPAELRRKDDDHFPAILAQGSVNSAYLGNCQR